MITSTIVVACRGARRWFDLDSVRKVSPPDSRGRTQEARAGEKIGSSKAGTNGYSGFGRDVTVNVPNPAGAPPLDWHHDNPEPGVIVIGEAPDDERDDPIALAVKIVDCMCPREVCTVCGVPRERVTGETSYTRYGEPCEADSANFNGLAERRKASGHSVASAPTLGWSDCGHNAYRRGRVFDPYHNPAIEAACAILDRDYITS